MQNLQKQTKFLQQWILSNRSEKDIFNFLRDLLTEWEMLEFQQRLNIAYRLYNWEKYKMIEKETDVSSTTIARVAKFLNWKYGWYKRFFDGLK